MKKKFVLALALALTLSLTACNKPAAEPAPAETVVTEQPQTQDAPNASEGTATRPLDQAEPQELTEEELYKLFEEVYIESVYNLRDYMGVPFNILLDGELSTIKFNTPTHKELPSDYKEQYKAWRETYQITDLSCVFVDQEQTMYVVTDTDAYNGIYESDNVACALKKGQSIQATGFGYDKAAGWIRIELNGDEVYVSAKYLSDSKPSTQTTQNTNNSGGQQNNNGGSQGNSGGQQSNGGGYNGTGMTLREISKLPDSQKQALGFHQLSNGAWVDSDGMRLPEPERSQEDIEKDRQNIENAGIILGSG